MSALTFNHPAWLWLLALLPAVAALAWFSRRRLSRARGITVMVVRCILVMMLAVALAEPASKKRSDYVSTYFLLDRSGSIPDAQKQWSLAVARQAVESKRRKEDRAGIIIFGEKAMVEESPSPDLRVTDIFGVVEADNSDIAGAVRLALSTFPEDAQKRIALLTDGNETRGDLLEMASRAAGAGVPVDVVPLKYRYDNEVLVESLSLPRKVTRDEPFQMRVNVQAFDVGEGTLRLYADGQLIGSRDVTLSRGDNVFLFSHTLREQGFHLFEAEVVGRQDGILQNNRAQAYTIIEQESMVLLAGGREADVAHLSKALTDEKVPHRVRVAGALPQDLGEWQSYDVIIFANLGAEHVPRRQMELIESAVRDLGVGFIMVGGEHSFGAGGYLNTPIARLLPVDLDVNQNQVLPVGAVVFLMDHIHCIGDRWSKDIIVGTLDKMHRHDMIGVRDSDRGWVVPLAPAGDKARIREIVNGAYFGELRNTDSELATAREALTGSNAGYRHTIIVTDGSIATPSDAAVRRLREAGITLSICVIEPRGSVEHLRAAARAGGGNFYVIQPSERHLVPQVIIKESVRVKKGLYVEERFQPQMVLDSEILEGIRPSDLPPLSGYNVTSKKQPTEIPVLSHKGDAVLAQWHCGLGKAVAFTSDASGRWAPQWITWPKYPQFWSQAVRWCQRRLPASPYQLTLQRGRQEGTCEAIIDAVDDKGRFVNFLEPRGQLVRPDLESRELRFSQVGPGRYKAAFPVDKAGGYVVNVRYSEGGSEFLLRGGYVPPYQPEYQRFEDNEALLAAVAERTGGRVIRPAPGIDFFAPTSEVTFTARLLWPAVLMAALILFAIDVFIRRVIIGPRDVVEMAQAALAKMIPALRPKTDRVAEALAAERAAMRERAAWAPPARAAEVGAEGETPGTEPAPEPVPAGEALTTDRLREAKERAKRRFER